LPAGDPLYLFHQAVIPMKSWIVSLFLAFLSISALAGCDLLLGRQAPSEARILLEGTDSLSVYLVTSTKFVLQRKVIYDEETGTIPVKDTLLVNFLDADSVEVGLDYEQTLSIREAGRLFVRVWRIAPEEDNLRMRIWLDGRLRYDNQAPPHQEKLQFIYYFVQGGDVIEEIL